MSVIALAKRNAAIGGTPIAAEGDGDASTNPRPKNSAPVDLVLSRADRPRRSGRGYVARCPVPGHHDSKPSLSIAEGADGRALVHCFGGCDVDIILAALGIAKWQLFPEGSRERARPRLWKGVVPLRHDGQPALWCLNDPVVALMVGELARLAQQNGDAGDDVLAALERVGRAAGAGAEDLVTEIAVGITTPPRS